MSCSTGSATIPAVERLSDDVLSNIALYLKGIDAVNFGRVCKAWVKPAERAIWTDIRVDMKPPCGETPRHRDSAAPNEASPLANRRGPSAPRAVRIREKYESVLFALCARPARRHLVRTVTVSCEGGFQAATLLSTVRNSLQTLDITLPPDLLEGEDTKHLSLSTTNLWNGMRELALSAQFLALRSLHLELDSLFTTSALASLLHLAPNLSTLSLRLYEVLDTEDLQTLPAVHSQIKNLTLDYGDAYQDLFEPNLASQFLTICPNLHALKVSRPMETGFCCLESYSELLEYFHPDVLRVLRSLHDLEFFHWDNPIVDLREGWQGNLFQGAFKRVNDLKWTLPEDIYIRLESFDFEGYVPPLPNLYRLSLINWRIPSDDTELGDGGGLTASGRLPGRAIRSFDSAPQLSAIFSSVYRQSPIETPDFGESDFGEALFISTICPEDKGGPNLYVTLWVPHASRDLVPTEFDWRDSRVKIATSYRDEAVPREVLWRMADVEGVKEYFGRGIKVSREAWDVLETYEATVIQDVK